MEQILSRLPFHHTFYFMLRLADLLFLIYGIQKCDLRTVSNDQHKLNMNLLQENCSKIMHLTIQLVNLCRVKRLFIFLEIYSTIFHTISTNYIGQFNSQYSTLFRITFRDRHAKHPKLLYNSFRSTDGFHSLFLEGLSATQQGDQAHSSISLVNSCIVKIEQCKNISHGQNIEY